jgi:hypothetical protein
MSVGSNGIDDGGDGQDGWINDGEWQTEPYLGDRQADQVIRVPVPRRSPAEREKPHDMTTIGNSHAVWR